jgi:hypothetical protein
MLPGSGGFVRRLVGRSRCPRGPSGERPTEAALGRLSVDPVLDDALAAALSDLERSGGVNQRQLAPDDERHPVVGVSRGRAPLEGAPVPLRLELALAGKSV